MTMPWEGGWDVVMESHLDTARRERLASASVGLAGSGGLGSNCAMLLARSGVGRFVVADFDRVSVSNLNRQNFLPGHVGKAKVEALAEMLALLTPCALVNTHMLRLTDENVASVFAGCDVVVEAVDAAPVKRMLLESLSKAGIFVVSASGMAGWGGPAMHSRPFGSRAVIVGDGTHGVSETMPVLAPRVMMAAAMQADQVLRYLLGPCPGMNNSSS